MRPRLITIPISHYCERARWALDEAGVDYAEDQHLQAFAGRVTRRAGANRTVPALVVDDRVLSDSADIVRWASKQSSDVLYPEGIARREVEALEDEFADAYGVETRRIAYSWFFRNLGACLPYNEGAAPRYQGWFLRAMKGLIAPRMVKYLSLNDERIERGRALIQRVMDDTAARLADGRPYLFGDVFTAADLTFAAMTAPSVLPRRYGMPFPPPEVIDDQARGWVERMRSHPAGQFTMRLYERRPPPRGNLPRELRRPPR